MGAPERALTALLRFITSLDHWRARTSAETSTSKPARRSAATAAGSAACAEASITSGPLVARRKVPSPRESTLKPTMPPSTVWSRSDARRASALWRPFWALTTRAPGGSTDASAAPASAVCPLFTQQSTASQAARASAEVATV